MRVTCSSLKALLITVLMLSGTLGSALANPVWDANNPVRLVSGNGYMPFVDQTLPNGGIITEVVQAALTAAGAAHDLEWQEWADGYKGTQELAHDITFPYRHSKKREQEMYFSDALIHITPLIFATPDALSRKATLQSLTGKSFCLPEGYAVPPELAAQYNLEKERVFQPVSMRDCFEQVLMNQADFTIENVHVGRSLMRELSLQARDLLIVDVGMGHHSLHAIVSKQHPHAAQLLATINDGLKILRQNGRLNFIERISGNQP